MKHVTVIQHTQSEWLGLIEDHLEGRGIRFGYVRPFTGDARLPNVDVIGDGLILVGGGPWGAKSAPLLPTLDGEVRLARAGLMMDIPVLGFGLGAQVLSLAADGDVEAAPLSCSLATISRIDDNALNGFLPEAMPLVEYGRDRARPPAYAKTLAVDAAQNPAIFQIGERSLGFSGHPGVKLAMIEDLVMEHDDSPDGIQVQLRQIRDAKTAIEDALVPLMTGIIQLTDWMES